MDEVILRFPHLGVQIFQELDVGSLLNYKQVSGSWKNFIESEKPLSDKFVIMRLVYGYWKDLPTCLGWVKNNFNFIMYKFKCTGIYYNISYMRIIIPRDLKNLQSETEFCGICGSCPCQCSGHTRIHAHPSVFNTRQINFLFMVNLVFQCYHFSKQFLSNLSKIKYLAFFITSFVVVSLTKMVTYSDKQRCLQKICSI